MAESKTRFLDLLRALIHNEIDFVIIGGVAGVLAGVPLSTFDLDIVFARDEGNLQRILSALRQINARYRDPADRRFEPDIQKLKTLRMNLMRTELGDLDLMPEVGPGLSFEEPVPRSHEYAVGDVRVRAIDLPTLIETKEWADRPKDRHAVLFLREALALQNERRPGDDEPDGGESA